MAEVDPEDDTLRRYVVRHYRYDPERHERRHVIVAAFDSPKEYERCLRAVAEEIDRRKGAGEHVDPREHSSGAVSEPGSRRRAANGRLVTRALQHGVAPGPWIDELEMPSNIAILTASAGWSVSQTRDRLARFIRHWLTGGRYRLRPPHRGS